MADSKERGALIRAGKLTNSTVTGNTTINADLIHAEEIEGLDASGNLQIDTPSSSKEPWYVKPRGILMLGAIASLLGWGILRILGLA